MPSYIQTRSNDIKIERPKAERIISQVLREDAKIGVDQANSLAHTIATRLQSSMSAPTRPALRGDRMITKSPPGYGGDESYFKALEKVVDIRTDAEARDIWDVVYSFGRDLPDDVVV